MHPTLCTCLRWRKVPGPTHIHLPSGVGPPSHGGGHSGRRPSGSGRGGLTDPRVGHAFLKSKIRPQFYDVIVPVTSGADRSPSISRGVGGRRQPRCALRLRGLWCREAPGKWGRASVCSGDPGKAKGALGLVKVGLQKKLSPGLMSPSPTTEFHHLCTQRF